ncbi:MULTISPECIES: hypothetical protein [Bizionia]|uniref:Uncharacterized protein n=1 Tax=Bizionia algoritergicola TaxID=291187 RepID=A0A5D0R1B2_9FLAO|nr:MULTISPECIES: hypothetical protein [Bizionia]OBX24356.1 hypothetical protein BAA08_00750 [Bizionia sp. APA-3]TYB75277.1 hypothetical protein ES675_03890 [Bizionia algoritergicola]
MKNLTINYTKKRLYIHLILGVFWLTLGTFIIWENTEFRWYNLGFIVAGALYLAQFIWDISYQYINITDTYIRKNNLFVKKLLLKDISQIEKLVGGYMLKTKQKELTIKSHLIDKNSLIELEFFLDHFEVLGNEYYELKL